MKRKTIRLKEAQFRELVSSSVKKILKEALSHSIDGSHGTFGGWETGKYGHNSMEIDFDPTDNDKMAQALQDAFEYGEFKGLSPEMFMEGGQYSDIWPIKVRIDYEIKQGGKGDGYLSPDDPDEVEIKNWYADTDDLGEIKPFVDDLIKSYIEDGYFDEEEVWENESSYLYESFDINGNEFAGINENKITLNEEGLRKFISYSVARILKESNLGITTHFDGKSSFKPENSYEDMTWDEYRQKKADEKEDEKSGKKKWWERDEDKPKNKGVTTHFGNLNEISKGLLDRAREAAYKDMMRNFGDSKIRHKRDRQWRKFTDEYGRLDREEKDSICPRVDEADLVNMPEDTYVVMNGDGRDAVSADFRTSYSGRAGTKEQCEEYVKRFYDMSANWEYLPEIVPLEDYLNSKRRQ